MEPEELMPKADEKQRSWRAQGRKGEEGRGVRAGGQEVDVLKCVDCEGKAALFSICED